MSVKPGTIRTDVYEKSICAGFNTQQNFRKWETNRHCNAEYELHFIICGTCTLSVKDTRLFLSAPEAVVIRPGVHHMPETCSEDFLHFSVSFSPLTLRGAEPLSVIPEYVLQSLTGDQSFLCERLVRECTEDEPCREEMISSMLSEIFIDLLRSVAGFRKKAQGAKDINETGSDVTDKFRTDIIDNFFENRHAEDVDEQMLAAELHVSTRQLSRILRKNYGVSFREKLLSARMDHASWLLRTTDRKVSEISEAAGYSSEGSLFRHFRSYFGLTPAQYRKKMKNGIDSVKH